MINTMIIQHCLSRKGYRSGHVVNAKGGGGIVTCDLPMEQSEYIIGFSPTHIPYVHKAVNVNVRSN